MNFGRKTDHAALMTGSMALGALVVAAAFTGAGSTANAATKHGPVGNVRAAGPNGTFVSNEGPGARATRAPRARPRKTQARSQRSRSTKGGWAVMSAHPSR